MTVAQERHITYVYWGTISGYLGTAKHFSIECHYCSNAQPLRITVPIQSGNKYASGRF